MTTRTAAVVGAGLAGLTCARALTQAGLDVTVFDKSRGLGGRLATRRFENGDKLDHGAPWVDARADGFRHMLKDRVYDGSARYLETSHDTVVGLPGMSGFVKPLVDGFKVERAARVSQIVQNDDAWFLEIEKSSPVGPFDHLVLAIPAPQAETLVAPDLPALAEELQRVKMAPTWTLLLGFDPGGAAVPDQALAGPFEKIIRESAKPGRGNALERWVVHMDRDWTEQNLELEKDAALTAALGELERLPGCDLDGMVESAAHRWLYARTSRALEAPYLADGRTGLVLAGDWCLGARAEHAHSSGLQAARHILDMT